MLAVIFVISGEQEKHSEQKVLVMISVISGEQSEQKDHSQNYEFIKKE